ncbi:hypothetical protein [Paraliobacillus ryukyuensis]|uniref:hypothetical protein n=1 Tax=Paraliobacillus ryukyuensis TaxID=200904 RepID=UPI00117C69A5|nr:hypothetical protein [Paraliobacillus ryukyuensis]
MQTLDSPVFEVKQDSKWYKNTIERERKRKEFFKKINSTYFKDNGFAYYHDEHFGVQGESDDYEAYKDELKKNSDKNGVYIFKKRSKYFDIFSEILKEVEKNNDPFKRMDVLGMNNAKGSQWLGDRWFFSVKNESEVVGKEVEKMNYKDYLKVVMEHTD